MEFENSLSDASFNSRKRILCLGNSNEIVKTRVLQICKHHSFPTHMVPALLERRASTCSIIAYVLEQITDTYHAYEMQYSTDSF